MSYPRYTMTELEFTASEPTDPRLHAGWEAEKQTAHFLDREFGSASDIRVFHGLRFLTHLDNDAAQIDHLILYRHGIAIIETKSVSGTLYVDNRNQWLRKWKARSGRSGETDIPSPVLQAERQATALRRLLQSANPPLMDKLAGLVHKSFREFPIVPYIGVSVNGRFDGNTRPYEQRVMKADEITRALTAQIEKHRKGSGLRALLLAKSDDLTIFTLNNGELDRMTAYLKAHHTPRGGTTEPAVQPHAAPKATSTTRPTSPTNPTASRLQKREQLICPKCGTDKSVAIVSTRRGYCGVCDNKAGGCGTFLPLSTVCDFCKREASIHKDGPTFYRDCADDTGGCGKQVVFWTVK